MKKVLAIAIAVIFLTGCSWIMKLSPGWGAEKAPTPEQKIEQLMQGSLDLKYKLGKEMQTSAQLQARNLMYKKKVKELEEEIKELKAKIVQLEMKPTTEEKKE